MAYDNTSGFHLGNLSPSLIYPYTLFFLDSLHVLHFTLYIICCSVFFAVVIYRHTASSSVLYISIYVSIGHSEGALEEPLL